MKWLDLTLFSPAENLALDEALLLAAEQSSGGEVLRIWECTTKFIVLGAGCEIQDDVDTRSCKVDGVPILRRSSGGGAASRRRREFPGRGPRHTDVARD